MCIVDQAIEDRISDSCLFDVIVPPVDGQLSYYHCGRESIANAIFDATGARIRDLLITKEKAMKMLRSISGEQRDRK